MMKTHIYDFTPEELEEIRRVDAEIERREYLKKHGMKADHDTTNCGGDRRSDKRRAFERLNRVGNPIWEYRVKHNISQKELAKKMYVSQGSISEWERGVSKISQYALEWLRERGEAV